MSLLKKSDVKNHLSPHFRTKLYLCPPESQPDATGFPLAEPDIADRSLTAFAVDFIAEHSFSETFLAAGRSCHQYRSLSGAYDLEKRASVKPHSVFLRWMHSSRASGSPYGANRRKLDACRRDHRAGLRHHDPPEGLALHASATTSAPNGIRVHGESSDSSEHWHVPSRAWKRDSTPPS